MFVEREVAMSAAAREGFANHTKKMGPATSEICSFIRLDGNDERAPRSEKGYIHAVLPTKLLAPLGMHIHGGCLLNANALQMLQ